MEKKNATENIDIRMDQAEEKTDVLEDRKVDILSEENEERSMTKLKNACVMCGTIK